MSYQKLFEPAVSGESAKARRADGKKSLGYVCCHVPEEIFYAADVLPIRLRATGCIDSSDAEAWMSSFSCSYARSILQYLMNGTYDLDGIVQSQGCMMQARIIDNWVHIAKKNGREQFGFFIGAPRIKTEQAIKFYKSELQEFSDALGAFSGKQVTDKGIKDAVAKTNETRKLISELYALRKEANPVVSGTEALSICLAQCDTAADEYNGMLREFLAEAKTRRPIDSRVRLMLIGSALDNSEYIKVIEDAGGLVVADYNCFGDRAFGAPIELDDADVMGSLARYYLTRNTCPRELDNRPAIHAEIVALCKEYSVQGVVYEKMQNCECWGGEIYYLEPDLKQIGIPVLQVEREEQMANIAQLAVRAEAFIEMLEK
ncbi:MAG: 2-hydroxyacyl-CoA dehydratase family protein [Oscillospiraceae bacterium]